MKIYLALDGTKDVDQRTRCQRAARIGRYCLVCLLPQDKDPDDLSAEQLSALKADARPVLYEWLSLFETLAGDDRAKALAELRPYLAEWAASDPAMAGELRAAVCAALAITAEEYAAWLKTGSATRKAAIAPAPAAQEPAGADLAEAVEGQPAPLGPAPKGEGERDDKELCNFILVKRANPKFGKKDEPEFLWVPKKIEIDIVQASLTDMTGGWPVRVRSLGAKNPLLFADIGGGNGLAPAGDLEDEGEESKFSTLLRSRGGISRIRWLPSQEQFRAWLHERTRLKFHDRMDCDRCNFVGVGDLFHSLGGNESTREYCAVEVRPHYPVLRGHYYAWSQPAKTPESRGEGGWYLKRLLEFFDNCKDRNSVAVLLAAILTPGWGGPYGKRPSFVATAADRGYGKSTICEMIAKIWGGYISINYEQRNDEELYQRLLSTEAMVKRVAIIDNVKGTFASSTVEQLITSEMISGKRMYTGEASRPNIMTYFITANGVRLSRDMASRSYCIELVKPEYRPNWDEELAQFVFDHAEDVICDAGMLLQRPVKSVCSKLDRWGRWVKEVLCRACDYLGDVTPDQVMESTRLFRDECDDDAEEARLLVAGVIESVACDKENGWVWTNGVTKELTFQGGPSEDVFVTSTKMTNWFKDILSKPKLGAKQVNNIMREHMEAGRMKEIKYTRRSAANGYEVAAEDVRKFLAAYEERAKGKATAQAATEVTK